MDTLLQDVRYAVRTLLRSPGFAGVAIVTLALGIGANSAVFSLANAVFLRPIPAVADPAGLVRIYGGEPGSGGLNPISYPDYQDVAAGTHRVYSGVAAAGGLRVVRDGDVPTPTQVVSGDYFRVLGVRPALGRGFLAADDQPGARPVAVVSHRLWTRELGGTPDVLGGTLRLNGQAFTIVGVAAEGFHGTEVDPMLDVWVPLQQVHLLRGIREPGHGSLTDRGSHWLFGIARLRPGVAREQGAAALQQVAARLNAQNPGVHEGFRLRQLPGGTLVSAAGAPEVLLVFAVLMVVVGAVLCVACANVANLLLARAAARRREIAVRLSLGAGRGRLVRQLLTESLLLALCGGAAGVALARLSPLLFRLLELPSSLDLSVDGRVLLHAAAVTLLTGLLFGLAPALQSVRAGTVEALKEGTAGGGRSGSRLRAMLTATQVALSLAMLVAAGLLLRSLWLLQSAAVPYDEAPVAVSWLDPAPAGDPAGRRLGTERLLEAAAGTPGVERAAVGSMVPMADHREEAEFVSPGGAALRAQLNVVSAGYFEVLRLPVAAGRALGPTDRAGGAPVAVVSRALAGAVWPGRSPLGQRLRSAGETPVDYEVVGVVDDVVYSRGAGVRPTVYLSWEQSGRPDGILHVRTRPGTTGLEPALTEAARGAGVALLGVRTLPQMRREAAFPQRMTGVLLSICGGVGLLLAGVGLYGVVAYGVAQRTREIGVRVALGARPAQVRRLVVGEGVRMAAAGVAFGLILALGIGQALRTLLFGVTSTDPLTFGGVAALLLAVAAGASWIPARRAARLEPMRALRSE